jgi:hypothetical protein
VKFGATRKRYDNKFFSPLSFVAVFGSGMGKNQDLGSGMDKNQDPGSGIKVRIRDPG